MLRVVIKYGKSCLYQVDTGKCRSVCLFAVLSEMWAAASRSRRRQLKFIIVRKQDTL